jgi:hypothetical protein
MFPSVNESGWLEIPSACQEKMGPVATNFRYPAMFMQLMSSLKLPVIGSRCPEVGIIVERLDELTE